MPLKKLDHIGIVVNDLQKVVAFFNNLGLEKIGEQDVEGDWISRIYGVEAMQSTIIMMKVPNTESVIELINIHNSNEEVSYSNKFPKFIGASHFAFQVENIESVVTALSETTNCAIDDIIQYENLYKLCYINGPEGIYVELAEKL